MNWIEPAALAAVVVVFVLPSSAVNRAGSLVRSGRLGGRVPGPVAEQSAAIGSSTGAGRWPAPRVLMAAGVAACLALAALVGIAIGVELAVVLGVIGLLSRDLARSRESQSQLSDFRVAVGLLAEELRAGTPPPAALAAAAASSPRLLDSLEPAARTAGRGGDTAAVLAASTEPQLRRLGVVWRVGEVTGIPLADVLDQFGSDLRSAADQRRAVSVELAGPRSSAMLLCLLPLLGIGLGAAMGARPLALLFGGPAGQLLGCAGLLLDAAGVLWVRAILLRAARDS